VTHPEVDDTTRAFFLQSGSTQLEKIYLWARARYAAPWAVFGAVLLRVAASVGPNVQLPGLIGGRASLNLLCAFVSASGGGKGISDKVGRLAWPTTILELPIGSGEGIAATFKKPDKPDADDEPIISAIFSVPEIDSMAGIAARQGSVLLAQLKSMAMGEQLGQSNASKTTSRVVEAHSYRCCLSVGAQPGHTGVLFDDTSGGTPQRFLWFPTTDASMPETRAPDPEPLDTTLPAWSSLDDVEIQYGPDEVAETIISAHIARQRGQADALDGHRMLTRCKVAAVLAIMHGRSVVSEWDWERSADVMALSDQTRDWIVTEAKRAARAKVRDRAMARAVGEEIVDERRTEVVRRRIFKILDEGPATHGAVHSRIGKREYKDLFPGVIASLLASGEVRSEETQRGKRYSVGDGVKVDTGVKVDNRRSDPLTPGVKVDPDATVTDLDTRRSAHNDVPRPTRTAHAFIVAHIAAHAGSDGWVAVSQIREAGAAEGHEWDALHRARRTSTSPRIITSATGPKSLWRVEKAEETA
jgi:hypothetical protein